MRLNVFSSPSLFFHCKKVIYDSSTFLEHNLDEGLAPALAAILAQSSNALVASLFAPSASNGDGKDGAAAPAATAVNNFRIEKIDTYVRVWRGNELNATKK